MGPARRVIAVARREYLATVKTRAFAAALVLMPLLMLAALSLPILFQKQAEKDDKRCAVIDPTGELYPLLVASAQERAELKGGQYILEQVTGGSKRQLLELSNRVRQGELFAFVEINPDILSAKAAGDSVADEPSIRYFSNTPSHFALRSWLRNTIERETLRLRFKRAGFDAEQVEALRSEVTLEDAGLFVANEAGSGMEPGQLVDESAITQPDDPEPIHDVAIPLGAAMLMFSSVMLGVGPLMQSALEEKMQRIAEVLVSSVPPFQLLLGKLLGASAVSYTMLLLYGGGAAVVATQLGVPPLWNVELLLPLLAFQAIALLMYGSVFLAVGSACSDLKESQTLMMPVTIFIASPTLLLQLVLVDPNGIASVAASLFPPFTPVLMLVRATLPPGAPLWQVGVGGILSTLMALSCLWAAARVFRVGMLMQGASPSFGTLLRWIRSG